MAYRVRAPQKALTPEQNVVVTAWVNERVGVGPGKVSQLQFSAQTGVSQQAISRIAGGVGLCGYGTACRFALYAGVPVDEFLTPLPAALRRLLHNRRMRPRWPEPAIAAVRTMAMEDAAAAEALTEQEWADQLDRLNDAIGPSIARWQSISRSRDPHPRSHLPISLHRKPPR